MAKKKQRKAAEASKPGQEQAAPSAEGVAKRAAALEIDEIFAKRRKQDGPQPAADESASRRRVRRPKRGCVEDPLGRQDAWQDDGLGGVYNSEGWTGRSTPGDKLRIFKAHLIKAGQGGGGTPLCPFDCDCCF
mmetsp:Transcript_98459/g.228301  ORF Transcript_98459/g.228301 Transcript_98459/m.228301 type:complete len:133 (-) Transcript_98459:15-413(-)